jgi:peptide/nickel transport system substrate-binding protein
MSAHRKLLAIGGGVVAAALLLAGCASSGGDDSATSSADHDSLRVSLLGTLTDVPDPDVYYGGPGLNIINNAYEGLVRYSLGNTELTVEPWLATEWEPNEDFTQWTFHLRDDVVFHDGTPLTSAAVAPSVERRAALEGGSAYVVKGITDIATPDDYTVTFTLDAPNSSFASILASPFGLKILSPTALEANAGSDNAQSYLATHDIGSGPYELTSADADTGYTLEYFDDWWGKEPEIKTVDLVVVQDASSLQLQFDSGDLDIIRDGLTGAAFASYEENDDVDSYSLPILQTEQMRINPAAAPFDDVEFRQAFRSAIDVDTILSQVFVDAVEPASTIYGLGFLPEGMGEQDVEYDPSQLEDLVAELPAAQRTITVAYRAGYARESQLVAIVAAQLQELGLTVEIHEAPTGEEWTWIDDPTNAPDVFFAASYPDGQDPYLWAELYWPSDAALNTFGCADPFIDENLPVALATADEDLYNEIGKHADATGCWTNLAYLSDFMVTAPWVAGLEDAHDFAAPGYIDYAVLGTE